MAVVGSEFGQGHFDWSRLDRGHFDIGYSTGDPDAADASSDHASTASGTHGDPSGGGWISGGPEPRGDRPERLQGADSSRCDAMGYLWAAAANPSEQEIVMAVMQESMQAQG